MHTLILTIILAPPLPWPIPVLPSVPESEPIEIELGELEHSEGYEDRQEEIEDQIASWSEPITDLTDTLGVWIGEEGTLPNADGDFETGFAPLDDIGTAYELADWLGDQITVMFSYVRTAASLPGEVFGFIITLGLICATVLLLFKMFDFGLSIFDSLWAFTTKIIEMVGAFLPTGG